jgi:hypothetical protein
VPCFVCLGFDFFYWFLPFVFVSLVFSVIFIRKFLLHLCFLSFPGGCGFHTCQLDAISCFTGVNCDLCTGSSDLYSMFVRVVICILCLSGLWFVFYVCPGCDLCSMFVRVVICILCLSGLWFVFYVCPGCDLYSMFVQVVICILCLSGLWIVFWFLYLSI